MQAAIADLAPGAWSARHTHHPRRDHIVLLEDVTWADYQRLLKARGPGSSPRIAFLEGRVEIVSPSMPHESLAARIGQLVETWCLEHDVEFRAVGSWTIKNERRQRGGEPDECYIFGTGPVPRRPDLAIEVIWTSGGVDKLEIWRGLGVQEVWFWRRGRLSVHVLRGDAYEDASASGLLPGIDVSALASFLDRPTDSQCIRAYRAHLQQR